MEALALQVLDLCPDHSRADVLRDLAITGCAETTINRIFDGTVRFRAPLRESCHSCISSTSLMFERFSIVNINHTHFARSFFLGFLRWGIHQTRHLL